jgi:hypothetical protein
MFRHWFFVFSIAALAWAVLAAPARADSFELRSNSGPIRLHVERDGEVSGHYPKYNGTLSGHVDQAGEIRGIWTQPTSDHPCERARNGTYSWGLFVISSPYHKRISGAWGYCGETPQRDWELGHE